MEDLKVSRIACFSTCFCLVLSLVKIHISCVKYSGFYFNT